MYCGYNLNFDDGEYQYNAYEKVLSSRYYEKGLSYFEKNKKTFYTDLEKFVTNGGSQDGSAIQNNWFPKIQADIFISHSHKDEKDVIMLAGSLKEEFGLNIFIDSCVWGSAEELLKIIDNKYCKKPNGLYDYEKRNLSTSHIYMMLSTALLMMIDNAECVFFYNTPNSISPEETIERTSSPWIYSELNISRLIRRKDKLYHRKKLIEDSIEERHSSAVPIKYIVDTSYLKELDEDLFSKWINTVINTKKFGTDALDILYKISGVEKDIIRG